MNSINTEVNQEDDGKSDIKKIYIRLNELEGKFEDKFIEQEHRFWRSLITLIKVLWSEDRKNLRSAWIAFLGNLRPGKTVTIISLGSIVGVFTIYLMYLNNQLIEKQNYHLQEQNFLSTKVNLNREIQDAYESLYEKKYLSEENRYIASKRPQTRGHALKVYLELKSTVIVPPVEPTRKSFYSTLITIISGFDKLKENEIEAQSEKIIIDLTEADLSDIKFEDLQFEDRQLSGYRFILKEANLQNIVAIEMYLRDADMSFATLNEAKVNGTDLTGSAIFNSEMIEIDLTTSILIGANLKESDLSVGKLNGADFSSSVMESANLNNVEAISAKFVSANLTGVIAEEFNFSFSNFEGSKLNRADFSKGVMERVNLNSVEATQAKFMSVDMRDLLAENSDFSLSDFSDSDITDSKLNNTVFSKSNFTLADLSGSEAKNTNFESAILLDAYFIETNLNEANFKFSDMRGMNLSYSNLRGAVLEGANLEDANFEGVENLTCGQLKSAENVHLAKNLPINCRVDTP